MSESGGRVWTKWPSHVPSPIDNDYQCYTITDKKAVEKYREKFGREPEFNIVYRNMKWLGPNHDTGA